MSTELRVNLKNKNSKIFLDDEDIKTIFINIPDFRLNTSETLKLKIENEYWNLSVSDDGDISIY